LGYLERGNVVSFLAMNDKGIAIYVYPFGHEHYPFDSLGKK